MAAISIGRIVLPCVALLAGCAAAFVFEGIPARREASPEAKPVSAEAIPAQPATVTRDQSSPALATAEAQAAAVADQLASPPAAHGAEESLPAFDVARVEPTGEAVIAGRAMPGATVELLRNGERLDQAVADGSGLFVMVPSRLPGGSYELTLSARSPDGKLSTSKRGVMVALADDPGHGTVLPNVAQDQSDNKQSYHGSPSSDRASKEVFAKSGTSQLADAAPSNVPDAATTQALPRNGGASSSEARPSSQPAATPIPKQAAAGSETPQALAAATSAEGASSSPALDSKTGIAKTSTKIVSHGDSLWRISRLAYGEGTRYVLVYKANRERIRNPNLIYPGQVFVLPEKAH